MMTDLSSTSPEVSKPTTGASTQQQQHPTTNTLTATTSNLPSTPPAITTNPLSFITNPSHLPHDIQPVTPAVLADLSQSNLDKQLRELVKIKSAISSLTTSTRRAREELSRRSDSASSFEIERRAIEEEVGGLENEYARAKEELEVVRERVKVVEREKAEVDEKLTGLKIENARLEEMLLNEEKAEDRSKALVASSSSS